MLQQQEHGPDYLLSSAGSINAYVAIAGSETSTATNIYSNFFITRSLLI